MPQLYQRKGGEILVNTETGGSQLAQSIAALPGGGFVVVWSDTSGVGGDTPDSGVKGQRYDADGNKVGGEFLVNTATDGFQGQSEVAALDNGRFVVTWSSEIGAEGDDPGSGIKGQVFNADGTKSGGEFFVNTSMPDLQLSSAITTLANGNFVVSWLDLSGLGGDTDGGIKMQIFDSTGARVGGELLANTVTAGTQNAPAMAALASGGFAAVWTGAGKISFQLFDAAGAKVGSELQVNTVSGGSTPDIAQLGSGFIVTWAHRDSPSDSDGFDISAQLLDANGAKIGGEFQVNTVAAGDQTVARVAQLPDGSFLVTWQGPSAGDAGMDIHGQVFTAAGAKVGVEFVVNGVTAAAQTVPEITVLASGDIVATWTDASGLGGDAAPTSVKMQILTLATGAPTDIALSNASLSETAIDNIPVATLSATGSLNTSFTYTIVSDESGGAFRIDGDKLVVDDNLKLDFETQPSVEVRIRATDLNGNSYEETMTLTVTDAAIEARYSAGEEFTVPVDNAGLQGESIVTALEGGRFLVVWTPDNAGGLRGRIFEADGQPAGGDLVLTDFAFGSNYPALALPDGGFVLTWMGHTAVGDLSLVGQVFDAAGAPVGAKFAIDPSTAAGQHDAALVDSGHFVVVFDSATPDEPNNPGPYQQVRAQIFDLTGAKVGGDFQVNTTVAGPQRAPQVASLPGGGFVVAWGDGGSDGFGGADGFMAQIFDAGGAKVGGEIVILPDDGIVGDVYLAGLAAGGFVATWGELVDEGDPTEHVEFFGQIVGADGVKVGSAFFVDAVLSNYGNRVRVDALPNGGFVIAWNGISLFGDGDGDAVMAQLYDAAGNRVGDPFLVNQVTREDQVSLNVAVTEAGDLLFTWSDIFHPPGDVDANIEARLFTFVSEGTGDIVGTPGPDNLNGTAGADHILGLGGNDFLNGGAGADVMDGGGDDDVYIVDNAGDAVNESAGQGSDLVYALADYALTQGSSVETLSAIDWSQTSPLNLSGNDLANTIYGNAGANFLNGGGGADAMTGFGGDDVYIVDNAGDQAIEAQSGGNDLVYALVDYALTQGSSVETLSAIDWSQTSPLNLTGNGLANTIYGNAGANFLNGGAGADTMVGFGGDDVYIVDNAGDAVNEASGQGNDLVYALTSWQLTPSSSVEILSAIDWSATNALNLSGNGLTNTIYGNAGANFLNGGGGADAMFGFGGDDVYIVDDAGDAVNESAGQGNDLVYALADYALTQGSSIETLSAIDWSQTSPLNLSGNGLANTIYGNAGANFLNGGGGADVMFGFGGDDFYIVDDAGDAVNESAGQGSDLVYALVNWALTANSAVETLSAIDWSATNPLNLTGNGLANTIYGNAGANVLDGGLGADTLRGFGGADTFAFTTALGNGNVDAIVDFVGGTDRIALDDAVFAGLAPGALNANAFVIGAAAGDADDRIIYNQATGQLFYDADGNGAGAAVLFATLQAGTVLAASDFTVI